MSVFFLDLSTWLVARFANDVVKPKVFEMDETETLDKDVLKGLFDQGVSDSRFKSNSD